MAALTKKRRMVTLLFTYVVVSSIYAVVGSLTATDGRPLHEVGTWIDRVAPFQPIWVFVYAMVFLQALSPICVIADTRVLDRTVGGFLLMYALATPIWLLYPVTVPRPPVPIVDVWTYGVGLVRYVDPPTNCLPSMHVALGFYAAFVVSRHDRLMGRVLLFCATLITWSTLAIDQHWAADGIFSAFLAWLVDRVLFDLRPLPREAFRGLPRRWHWVWFGTFLVAALVLMSGWWLHWMPVELLPPNTERWSG